MKQNEFQLLSRSYIDQGSTLTLRDILDLAYRKALSLSPLHANIQSSQKRKIKITICWLEVVFLVNNQTKQVDFYGVQPVYLDMNETQPREFPALTFSGPPGTIQPLDWNRILSTIHTFNSNLPAPIGAPFARLSLDNTRSMSVYHKLNGFDYP